MEAITKKKRWQGGLKRIGRTLADKHIQSIGLRSELMQRRL